MNWEKVMRYWLAALAVMTIAAPSVSDARHYRHTYHVGHYGSSDYYTARSGHQVHRPMQAVRAPFGASAQCADRSWSFSENHRGTCSHHGGVSRWL